MKNNFSPGKIYRLAFLIPAIIVFGCCNRSRNNPGWDFFPDMSYSTAYETYTKNPNFSDSMTMRVPVPGTVPRGFIPFGYTIDPESRIKAGKELLNPFSADTSVLSRGKTVYSTFCINCHGISGAGDGYLFTSGLYPMKPRDLSGSAGAALKDGEIYHSITLGFGSMGAHGSQILPDDRWKAVLYIRKLQQDAIKNAGIRTGGNSK
jgi:cytochrome c5